MFTIKRWISNQSLGKKFITIGAMIGVLLGVLSWQAVSKLQSAKNTVLNEYRGVVEVQRLSALISQIQNHRGLSNLMLNGQTEAKAKITSLESEIGESWKKLIAELPLEWEKSRHSAGQL